MCIILESEHLDNSSLSSLSMRIIGLERTLLAPTTRFLLKPAVKARRPMLPGFSKTKI